MNAVLLTTETTHHLYFAWQVHERIPLRAILVETRSPTPPFDTFHPFEAERDQYEREVLLRGCASTFADLAETQSAASVNDPETLSWLRSLGVDVAIVFGTGRLRAPAISAARLACMNLHGGNPEHYRGLDTHLWCIYHEEYQHLVTTLHHVDADLDTGDIVLQSRVPLQRGTKLFELRAANTKICVELTVLALRSLQETGSAPARPQAGRGRYYSFMPAALKETCVRRFARYTDGL